MRLRRRASQFLPNLLGWAFSAWQDREIGYFCAFLNASREENRIKCGWNAVFPQDEWYKMAIIATNKQFQRGGFMASGMTKTQLVRHLAEKLETPNKMAAAFLEHLADTAVKETKKNGIFVVPGLGRLKKVHRKARVGRNPQTGEPIQIKAKTTAKFYLAKAAKDAIAPKK
jgi:DNA-binding protein HU-beta